MQMAVSPSGGGSVCVSCVSVYEVNSVCGISLSSFDPGISQRSLSLSFITTYTLFSLSLSPLLIPGFLNALSLLLPLIHCSLSLLF